MPRYKLTVAYDGTNFHGWQKQHPPGEQPLRTVQGVLEEAVVDAVREEVNVLGASRTDAGVHAMGQVAAFTCNMEIEPSRLVEAVTSRLPDDVQVREACIVPLEFDPIQDCVSKGYRYRLASARRGAEGDDAGGGVDRQQPFRAVAHQQPSVRAETEAEGTPSRVGDDLGAAAVGPQPHDAAVVGAGPQLPVTADADILGLAAGHRYQVDHRSGDLG